MLQTYQKEEVFVSQPVVVNLVVFGPQLYWVERLGCDCCELETSNCPSGLEMLYDMIQWLYTLKLAANVNRGSVSLYSCLSD